MNRRWKIYRMPSKAEVTLGQEHDEIHEGCERSLSRRLSELRTVTGKPYRAEEIPGDESKAANAVGA